MDQRKRDLLIPNRPNHRARTCRGNTGENSADNGRTEWKIVSIADFEAVRDALLDVLGPRGYRVAIARVSKRPTVVPIGAANRSRREQGKTSTT
jgi:hypothetical protein